MSLRSDKTLPLCLSAFQVVLVPSAQSVLHAVDFSAGAKVTVATTVRSVRVCVCVVSGTSALRVVEAVGNKKPGIGSGGQNPGMGGPPNRNIGPIPRCGGGTRDPLTLQLNRLVMVVVPAGQVDTVTVLGVVMVTVGLMQLVCV